MKDPFPALSGTAPRASSSLPASRRICPRCTSAEAARKRVALERRPVSQIFRFQTIGLLEIVEGLLVILPRLGILTLVVGRPWRNPGFWQKKEAPSTALAEQTEPDGLRVSSSSPHITVLIKISLAARGTGQDSIPNQHPGTRKSRVGPHPKERSHTKKYRGTRL